MSIQLRNLYGLHSELEALPAQAARADKDAAAKRTSIARDAANAERAIAERHQKGSAAAQARRQAAHDDLEQKPRAAAQSASAKGALPSGSSRGTGGSPDFARSQAADKRLGAAIDAKRQLEHTLQTLRQQLAREAGQAAARRHDRVTFLLFGIGVIIAIAIGANLVGAVVAITFATIGQIRLSRGPSAYVIGHEKKLPGIFHDRRLQSGVAMTFTAWILAATLVVTAIASRLLQSVHPYWNHDLLWRWFPQGWLGVDAIGAYVMSVLFWLGFVYAMIILIVGYVRRGGR